MSLLLLVVVFVTVVIGVFAFGAAANDAAAVQHDGVGQDLLNDFLHQSVPFQVPLIAASTQSRTEPNQASTPVIAGR